MGPVKKLSLLAHMHVATNPLLTHLESITSSWGISATFNADGLQEMWHGLSEGLVITGLC